MHNSQSANLSSVLLAVAGLPDPRSEGEMVNGTSLGPLFEFLRSSHKLFLGALIPN